MTKRREKVRFRMKRIILKRRLKQAALQADAGAAVNTTGMSDNEFLTLLKQVY